MNNDMRHFINTVSYSSPVRIDEGIIDSIKQWIQSLNSPVKAKGVELSKNLENQLTTKYGSQVSQQVRSSNPGWMWSRLTYQNLYKFGTQVAGFSDEELDRALKNPIVTNNLKALFKSSPDDEESKSNAMALPLKSAIIKNNTNFISTVVDPGTKQYLSKAIALAVLDGLAYIDQEKKDTGTTAQQPAANQDNAADQQTTGPDDTQPQGPAIDNLSTDELKAAVLAIRQGLAKIKGETA